MGHAQTRPVFDADQHRRKAADFAARAEKAKTPQERVHLLRMAKTSEVLAKNADWLHSIDAFLVEWRNNGR